MTKFEEEAIKEAEKYGYVMAKSKIVFYEDEKGITFVNFNGTHTNFNFPWLEFAKNWHSDEEFQAEKDARKKEYEIHQDIYSKTAKELNKAELEIADLKSQLQQQSLPVVPECVAEFIEFAKTEHLNLFNRFSVVRTDEKVSAWLSDSKAYDSGERRDEILARAWLDGYTVEKPQLFYLKNMLTTSYLALDINTGYYEHWGEEIIPKLLKKQGYKLSFTQQEINSMQTGSYELVPVEE